jgi:hypothetical protein
MRLVASTRSHDVQAIAASLVATGAFRVALPADDQQALVDVWWNALAAARALGCAIEITTSDPLIHEKGRHLVIVRVSCPPST